MTNIAEKECLFLFTHLSLSHALFCSRDSLGEFFNTWIFELDQIIEIKPLKHSITEHVGLFMNILEVFTT